MRHPCVRLGAPGAMATSPPLLYEVYLHAEHEEEERGVSPEEARAEESASASTDGFVVESANTSRTAVRLARRAARGAGGLAVRAARASLKLAGSPAPVGADEDRRHPVLAASARGAELAVAVGGVVRAFRDEDDFQRLLASWSAAPSASPVPGAAGKEKHETHGRFENENDRVVALSWAADGSAFAAATEGGDVHVVSRLGEPLRVQTKNDRKSRAPPVACFLALVRSESDDRDGGRFYDLLVITRACDGGARACAHVQRVNAPDATRRGESEKNGSSEENDERRVAAAGGRAVRVRHGCRVARAVANARRRGRERTRGRVSREIAEIAGRGAVAFRARRVGARRRADSAAARERRGRDPAARDPPPRRVRVRVPVP